MRDRLIEFIQASGCVQTWDYHTDDFKKPNPIYELADHLLANGVIVPPVKRNDKVYIIRQKRVKECNVVFIGLSADEKCSYFNFVENYADGTFYKAHSMGFNAIGKIVFLTKEEAEAALQKGGDGE